MRLIGEPGGQRDLDQRAADRHLLAGPVQPPQARVRARRAAERRSEAAGEIGRMDARVTRQLADGWRRGEVGVEVLSRAGHPRRWHAHTLGAIRAQRVGGQEQEDALHHER